MGAIVHPGAARLHELAGRDRGGMADHGDQVALAADLDPQDAEAVLCVVEGHPLDEAGERLARWLGCRADHANYPKGHRRGDARLGSARVACFMWFALTSTEVRFWARSRCPPQRRLVPPRVPFRAGRVRIPLKSAGDSDLMSAVPIEVGRPFRSMSAGVALPIGWDNLSIVMSAGSSHDDLLGFLFAQGVTAHLDAMSCPRFSWTAICPTGGSHDEVQHEQDRTQ